ncbi:TRAP transporter small permease [Consotaella aegiceratis]|uniref:TRAP transporter small permease n=1 Tax=Consotaella aegiceratis TaxID=3097961 RepID=UPI002F41E6A2
MAESTPPHSKRPIDLAWPLRVLVALTLIAVVAVTLVQIVLRYVFDAPLIWSEELVKLLIVWITFVGAGAVCFDGRHLNVDVFFKMLPVRLRVAVRWLNILLSLGFLAILGWTSITLVRIESMQELSSLPLTLGHVRAAATAGAILMIAGILARIFYSRPRRRRDDPAYGADDPM